MMVSYETAGGIAVLAMLIGAVYGLVQGNIFGEKAERRKAVEMGAAEWRCETNGESRIIYLNASLFSKQVEAARDRADVAEQERDRVKSNLKDMLIAIAEIANVDLEKRP